MRRSTGPLVGAAAGWLLVFAVPHSASAHAPLVVDGGNETSTTAFVLEDPTRSLALGSTIGEPGERDWYRMEMTAGQPLVVQMTRPDAAGGITADVVVLGPGLPQPTDDTTAGLAAEVGAEGAVPLPAEGDPARTVHAGLGFYEYEGLRTTAPADGTYWIVVRAHEPDAIGKYVLAPGVDEEFGIAEVGGMIDLVAFFNAAWPPTGEDEGGPPLALLLGGGLVVAGLAVVGLGAWSRRRHARQDAAPAADGPR
jgi:hypothetical protein